MTRSATLYLVRHGQTTGNGQRYVGWEDLPLDTVGQAQAEAAAALLRDVPLQALYCSPLQRARATAQALLAGRNRAGDAAAGIHRIDLQVRADLKEIHYGDFQGLLKDDQPLRLRHDHLHARMPSGESLADVHTRVGQFADELRVRLQPGTALAVVAHFWSLRMLAGVLRGLAPAELLATRDYKPGNGSVWALELDVDAAANSAAPARGRVPQQVDTLHAAPSRTGAELRSPTAHSACPP